MEIPEYLDEKDLCWAPKRMPLGSELQRHCECGVEVSVRRSLQSFLLLYLFCNTVLRARSPISSDAKPAGGEKMLLCRPSALALWNAL
eukprot:1142331-Pelagomonas_calceolata.AAC.3